FLDKQRVPVGLGDDLFHHFGGRHAAAGHPRDHAFNAVAVEATERQGADVGQTNPGRLELRSEGEHRKDRELTHPLDRQSEELEGGGIRPVRVLEREQDRLPAGETLELIEVPRASGGDAAWGWAPAAGSAPRTGSP